MAPIVITNLVKRFGEVTAVAGVDLAIADGEVVALLGPSGCGKTTMLRCLAGLEEPTHGSIQVGDRVLYGRGRFVPPNERDIAMVFQSYALWPHMTVEENIGFGLKVQRQSRDVVRRRVEEALELTGMSGFQGRYPSQLSGGQQQRVAVARALALQAAVVLFDEPLSNLDAKLREEVRRELKELIARLEITAVYVTHDISEATVLADRIAVMNQGRIEQIGTSEDIYYAPATEFVARFVGGLNLWAGTIAGGNGVAGVEVAGRLRVAAEAAISFSAGESVMVSVRPEHVRLSAGRPERAVQTFQGEVLDRTFLGSTTQYLLRVEGLDIVSTAPSRRGEGMSPGQVSFVEIDPHDVIIASRRND